MALIVDASVAIKWFIDEEGSREARYLLDAEPDLLDVEPDLLAPELMFPEVCSAAWRKVRAAPHRTEAGSGGRATHGYAVSHGSARTRHSVSARWRWRWPSIIQFTTAFTLPWQRLNKATW